MTRYARGRHLLALSGYHQNSALILRDVMEMVFLLDLFAGDPSLIERW
jgi:hypothetical protein